MVEKNIIDEAPGVAKFDNEGDVKIVKPKSWRDRLKPQCRWVFAFLGFLGYISAYLLRINLNIGIVAMINHTALIQNSTTRLVSECFGLTNESDIRKEDGEFIWPEVIQGYILGSFYWGYVLTLIPGGLLAQKFGGKLVFSMGMAFTILFTFLTPVMARSTFIALIIARFIEGLAEGVFVPSMQRLVAIWSPVYERSKMTAFVMAGTVVVQPLSAAIGSALGWEWIFYVTGLISTIWLVFFLFLVYDGPTVHPWISDEERDYILTNQAGSIAAKPPPIPWYDLFHSVPMWAIIICHLCNNWGWYTLLNEINIYLRNVQGFHLKKNAAGTAGAYLSLWIFSVVFSIFIDWLRKKQIWSNSVIRKGATTASMLLPALFLIGVAFSGCNSTLAVVCFVFCLLFNGARYSGFWSNIMDLAPNYAGAIVSLSNTAGSVPGFLTPVVTSYITHERQTTVQWRIVFLLTSGIYIFGNIVYVVFGSGDEQPWNRNPTRGVKESQQSNQPEETELIEKKKIPN